MLQLIEVLVGGVIAVRRFIADACSSSPIGGVRADAGDRPAAPLASVASQANPLLVLHDGHAFRCWPTAPRSGTRMHNATQSLDRAIGVDVMVEHVGPPSSVDSTGREVASGIRDWWDAMKTSPTATRITTSGREG